MIVTTVDHPRGSYEVLAGPLENAFERIDALAGGRPLPVVSDSHIFDLHGGKLAEFARIPPILLPRGEEAKTWDGLRQLVEGLARLGADRSTPIIAFGGGSVGDVTGLATSLYMRGCPVIHVPTTLLSQADSAIGGKTAIDVAGIKNLAGTFHHPALVVADTSLLDTLEPRAIRSGYAEVVKYGLIDDPRFFEWCETNGAAVIAGSRDAREFAIRHCIEAKARFVSVDPEDRTGRRALLNLGHTFGHAIEGKAGLGQVEHGEAVAIGLAMAFEFSASIGLCPRGDAERVTHHLRSIGLPIRPEDVDVKSSELADAMAHDKKNEGGAQALILARGIGQAFLEPAVDRSVLRAFLARG